MKNLHLIPTDKPSRLFEILQFNFIFDNQNKYSEEYKKLHKYKNQHIYITNDEEIKKGDWFLVVGGIGLAINTCHKSNGDTPKNDWLKKIILTTDPDLIKDGVQAIDDEFLEWYVKNPSCEWVEVQKWSSLAECGYSYHIIIPKEEPNKTHYLDEIPNTNKEVVLKMFEAAIPKLEPKRETFEEAAERLYPENWESIMDGYHDSNSYQRESFINGYKLAKERSYSEEEVIAFAQWMYDYKGDINKVEELLKQFKMKQDEKRNT